MSPGSSLRQLGGVFGFGNEADGKGAFGEGFFGDTAADEERGRMTGVDEFEVAFLVENAEEHGGVAADFGMAAEEFVDVIDDTSGIGAEGHGGKRALEHGGEESGAETFAGDVGEEEGGAFVAQGEDVEIVAADG